MIVLPLSAGCFDDVLSNPQNYSPFPASASFCSGEYLEPDILSWSEPFSGVVLALIFCLWFGLVSEYRLVGGQPWTLVFGWISLVSVHRSPAVVHFLHKLCAAFSHTEHFSMLVVPCALSRVHVKSRPEQISIFLSVCCCRLVSAAGSLGCPLTSRICYIAMILLV